AFRKPGSVKLTGSPFDTAEVVLSPQMKKWETSTAAAAAKRPDGVASQPIGRYETHTTTLSSRTKTGAAEQHRDWDDIFVVVSGEASLVSGGHLVDPQTVAPGELRGSGVAGGTTVHLTAGSTVHISPLVPHQLLLEPGAVFSYYVVKVKDSVSR
ncbi:MAG: hypothetical protein ABI197_04585, partial [Granulicella sp.]